MALCEGHLDSALPQLKREDSSERDHEGLSTATGSPETTSSQDKRPPSEMYMNQAGLPLTVDYRSPVSHFIPPAVELAAKNRTDNMSTDASESPTPMKRKRGRPRVDKTSPDYLAKSAARKQAKEMAAVMNSSASSSGEKRKRGRPRVDKTSPDYLARKRARELEALEKKAMKQHKRRGTGDSVASSSNDGPRVKRKYTKRALSAGGSGPGRPRKSDNQSPSGERVKGKRGRPRKADLIAAGLEPGTPGSDQAPKIRVRSNLMPINSEPISLDSDDEPDLGSPSQTSDSLSLDENLLALRHLHEKYANLGREKDVTHAVNSTGRAEEATTRVENLEDSSNSDSDSSSSASGSGSSSSSSSSSGSSSSSSESEGEEEREEIQEDTYDSTQPMAARSAHDSDSSLSPSPSPAPPSPPALSESENESPDKSYQCHICRKWYSTIVTLKIHRRSHLKGNSGNSRARNRTSNRYECDCCSESFNRREKLQEHKASVHRGAMTARCSVCRRCFEDDAELAAHDHQHTPDERAGRCSDCGNTFPAYSALSRHRQTAHGVPPAGHAGHGSHAGHAGHGGHVHACPQCGKGFGHAHSLTRHLHNHARQLYKCVVCKASFARADQLAQHLNSHLANYKRLKP